MHSHVERRYMIRIKFINFTGVYVEVGRATLWKPFSHYRCMFQSKQKLTNDLS